MGAQDPAAHGIGVRSEPIDHPVLTVLQRSASGQGTDSDGSGAVAPIASAGGNQVATGTAIAPLLGAASGIPARQPLAAAGFAGSPSAAAARPSPPALQRSSANARPPLEAAPATPAGSGRVSAREISFEQMFAPGAAAIASGAAYADSANSVVFHTSATPTPGSSGSVPAVQRFSLPGASTLITDAHEKAGTYADSARQSVGGLADRAQQAAGGDADKAKDAAGGYAKQALAYRDSAMGAARGAADQAGDTAAGLVDSGRSMAGGVADRAGGAIADSGSAAGKAAGGAVDAARGAVNGATAAAGEAASGAAAAVTGAAAGAAAGAAGVLPTDLNELARRLFDPLSERFKTELWLDRERAGMITDLRR